MSRNAVIFAGLGVLTLLVGVLEKSIPNESLRNDVGLFSFGFIASTAGALLVLRRTEVTREMVDAYDRYPKPLRGIYTLTYRLYRFKSFATYSMANTVVFGVVFIALGLASFGYLAYDLFSKR